MRAEVCPAISADAHLHSMSHLKIDASIRSFGSFLKRKPTANTQKFIHNVTLWFGSQTTILSALFFFTENIVNGWICLISTGLYSLCLRMNQRHWLDSAKSLLLITTGGTLYVCSTWINNGVSTPFFLIICTPLYVLLFHKDRGLFIRTFGSLMVVTTLYQYLRHGTNSNIQDMLGNIGILMTAGSLYLINQFHLNAHQPVLLKPSPIYDHHPFTNREEDIMRKLLQGMSNKEIGHQLFIAEATVKQHLRNIYRKCGVNSRLELLAQHLASHNGRVQALHGSVRTEDK